MTPEESALLKETHDSVIAIQATCVSCQAMVQRHRKIIDDNGLTTRVTILEKRLKWVKAQFAAMVGALAVVGKYLRVGK